MNETKFTPGPWRYVNGVQICSTKDPIAKVWMMRNGEGKANAHLIAVAPELYWVLHQVVTDIESQGVLIEWHQAILDVLAKARGEA